MQSTRAEDAPRVTVLMSVYNGERYLQEAIDSILTQTFTNFEFIIINDGSTDSSRDIIHSYSDPRIRLIDNPENIGLTKSLNRGLSLAKGHYVARQDADDRSHSERLQKQVAFLDDNPKVAVVGTQLRYIDADGKILRNPMPKRASNNLVFNWHWIFNNPLAHSTTVFKRDIVWQQLSGYNVDYRAGQDFELWCRVGRYYELCNLPDVLVDFRVHEGSVSRHYKPVDIMKLEKVYEYNIRRILQTEDFPRDFPVRWLHITIPTLSRIEDGNEVLRMFTDIRRRFIFLFPAALNNREIRDYTVFILSRCARYFATVDRRGALRFIVEIIRLSKMPLRELSIFAALFIFGEEFLKKALGLIKRLFAVSSERLL
jgi:glycosyltransferase involved in cell wall biosynthesis